jgi:hypothetical protein
VTDNLLNEYIRQLQETYKNKLYYFTLMGVMSLIDICAALNSPDGETKQKLFKDWFDKYLSEYNPSNHPYGDLTGFGSEECYKFRCRLLHQGRAEIDSKKLNKKVKTGKIAFHVGAVKIHCCNSNGVYFLDIELFMNDVITAVKSWIIDTQNVEHVQGNLSKIIQMRSKRPSFGMVESSEGEYIY